jgi:hypothetical protein
MAAREKSQDKRLLVRTMSERTIGQHMNGEANPLAVFVCAGEVIHHLMQATELNIAKFESLSSWHDVFGCR